MNEEFIGEALQKFNLYETLAEKLEEVIMNNPKLIGEKLPSEQVLADNYNVSRNVVREALKILKERGLVEVKNGEGAFVVRPQPQILTKMINRMVLLSDIDFSDIYEIRFPLEMESVSLAAQKISQNELIRLKEICEEMHDVADDGHKWAALDLEFHLTIAKATQNELFCFVLRPFTDSLMAIFAKALSIPGAKNDGLMGHDQLVSALSAGDSENAKRVMYDHLYHSQKTINRYREIVVEEKGEL